MMIMMCSICNQERESLTEIFDASCTSVSTDGNAESKMVCEKCVIGKRVPVFREASNAWQMGDVQDVDEDGMHTICFWADDIEKARISKTPFADYLSHCTRGSFTSSSNSKFNSWLSRDIFAMPPRDTATLLQREGIGDFDTDSLNPEDDPMSWTIERVSSTAMASPLRSTSPTVEPSQQDKACAARTPSRSTPGRKGHGTPRKALPRTWTTKEDQSLMEIVERSGQPTKWTDIAQSIPGRSGKQCRERYLNHLKPRLRFGEWTDEEDALLCTLYQSMGSKWAVMAKVMTGRTDNNIKNRFHHIRRRVEKEVTRIVKTRQIDEVASLIKVEAINRAPLDSETNSEFAIKVRQILPYLAADSVKDGVDCNTFGPFVEGTGECCKRCSFVVPSVQTGKTLCKKSLWCESCTKIPPYVVGDMLRQTLNLRKANEV